MHIFIVTLLENLQTYKPFVKTPKQMALNLTLLNPERQMTQGHVLRHLVDGCFESKQ